MVPHSEVWEDLVVEAEWEEEAGQKVHQDQDRDPAGEISIFPPSGMYAAGEAPPTDVIITTDS